MAYRKQDDLNGPPQDERREVSIRVPLTVADRARWRAIAKREGMAVTEMIRTAVENFNWDTWKL